MAQVLVLGEATTRAATVQVATGLPMAVTGVEPTAGDLGAQTAGGLLSGSRTVRGGMDRGRSGGEVALAQDQIGLDGLRALGAPTHRGRTGLDVRRAQRQLMSLLPL